MLKNSFSLTYYFLQGYKTITQKQNAEVFLSFTSFLLLFFLPTPAHMITRLASAGEEEDHEINKVSKNKNKLVFNYESVTKMSSQCLLAVAFHFIQSCNNNNNKCYL